MSTELRATQGVKLYDRVLEQLTKDLEITLMQAVDGSGLEKVDKIKATALGLTQAMLIAQAIEGMGDIGPAIEAAGREIANAIPS